MHIGFLLPNVRKKIKLARVSLVLVLPRSPFKSPSLPFCNKACSAQ